MLLTTRALLPGLPKQAPVQAPLTPLELHSRRRDAQSLVRRAYNELHTAINCWEKFHDAGLTAATAASNAYLSQWYLPPMPLGVLAQLPDIRGAAIAKYRSQASAQLGQVERAVDDSEAAAQQLRATADSLSGGCEHAPEGQAVFAALPLPLIAQEVARLADAHEAELELRVEILSCLQAAIDAESPTAKGTTPEQDRKRRAHMQVLLAAWMLQPKLDEAAVEGTLKMLEAEMKGS